MTISCELPSTYQLYDLIEVGASRVIPSNDRKLTERTLSFQKLLFFKRKRSVLFIQFIRRTHKGINALYLITARQSSTSKFIRLVAIELAAFNYERLLRVFMLDSFTH